MRLNTFSLPQYGLPLGATPSVTAPSSALTASTSTQREGGKIRQKPSYVRKRTANEETKLAREENIRKHRGYFDINTLASALNTDKHTVTNYNPYSGKFWYNGLEYQIPTNKKMLQEIKEKINKLAREAEQKLSVLV